MALVRLSKSNHSDLKILPVDLKYFSELPLIPIYFHEINQLACEYPLCFTLNDDTVDFRLISTVSQEQGSAFIRGGSWVGRYLPSYLNHYPFFAFSDNDEKSSIFVEDESPRLSLTDGAPLFHNSEPTEVLDKIVDVMRIILDSAKRTQIILEALKKFNLITPWEPKIMTSSDQEIIISGVYRIDETALNALSSVAWNELREINAFPMIYGQLFSTHNLTKLVIYQNLKLKLSDKEELGVALSNEGENINFDLANQGDALDFENL